MNKYFNKIMNNFFDKKPKIHFIGIGGAGMSALAGICLSYGYQVSGSDIAQNEYTDLLSKCGAKINLFHSEKNVSGCDIIVFSSAIKPDNCELVKAIKANKCVLERHKFLGVIFNCFDKSVAIAGSHGKTTACGMLSQVLIDSDRDPQILIGGSFDLIGGNYRKGNGCILAEACEYKRNFLSLKPLIAVLLNTDKDHMDYYKDEGDVNNAFESYVNNIKENGCCVINGDEENGLKIKPENKIVTYGFKEKCDFRAENIKSFRGKYSFDITEKGEGKPVRVKLSVFGRHNIYNALAAYSAAILMGVGREQAAKALSAFKGMKRRFEEAGSFNGAKIINDYAHHPKEIEAVIKSARDVFPKGRITAVFQPHTYSRTKSFMDKFSRCFNGLDCLLLLPVYAAREPYDREGSSPVLYENIKKNFYNVIYLDSFKQAYDYLSLNKSSCILILGAGDIYKLAQMLSG